MSDHDPHAGRLIAGIVEIDRKLVEVKERVGHGRYTAFVTERLGWSERQGRRFVDVFEIFKTANLAGLETLAIDASSLYLIAAPSTPEEARAEAFPNAAALTNLPITREGRIPSTERSRLRNITRDNPRPGRIIFYHCRSGKEKAPRAGLDTRWCRAIDPGDHRVPSPL